MTGTNGHSFISTLWSQVLAAADPDSPVGREALNKLMSDYWPPLYAFARARGLDAPTAADRVQEFFAELLEKQWLASADPERGRFRAFLKTAFVRFLAKQRERAAAIKRGGGVPPLSLDLRNAEGALLFQPAGGESPERVFDREWAVITLNHALGRLLQECADSGREGHFELLRTSLGSGMGSSEQLARQVGLTPRRARNTLHRMRRRLRSLLIEEIAGQVDDPREIASELAALRLAFE